MPSELFFQVRKASSCTSFGHFLASQANRWNEKRKPFGSCVILLRRTDLDAATHFDLTWSTPIAESVFKVQFDV